MENVVEALKEFFFDIIGFLIPGITILIVGNTVFKLPISINEENVWIILVISYILGYLIFSLTLFKEDLIKNCLKNNYLKETIIWNWIKNLFNISSENDVLAELSKGDTYRLASKIIRDKTKEGDLKLTDYKSFRNVAMSNTPEADKKVYTFMFRAELFNQLHSISLIVLLLLLLNVFLSIIPPLDNLAKNNINYTWFFLFCIAVFVLRKGWKRFYKIAMSVPFSLYIEKNKKERDDR